MDRQARQKQLANEAHAARYPTRPKAKRRKQRKQRVAARERRWIAAYNAAGGDI